MQEGHQTAKCITCGNIFLKKDLSNDGRCKECIKEGRTPKKTI